MWRKSQFQCMYHFHQLIETLLCCLSNYTLNISCIYAWEVPFLTPLEHKNLFSTVRTPSWKWGTGCGPRNCLHYEGQVKSRSLKKSLFKPLASIGILNEPWHVYDEVFYSESFVTMTYLDSWYIQNLYSAYSELETFKIRESLKYTLHRTFCNFGIITILLYFNPSILITRRILKTLSNMYDGP